MHCTKKLLTIAEVLAKWGNNLNECRKREILSSWCSKAIRLWWRLSRQQISGFLTHYLHQCSTHTHHGRARETNFCTVNSLSRKKNLTSNIKRERFASLLRRRASACQGAAKMWKAMAKWKELAGWVLLQTQTCCSFWKANKIIKLNQSWNKIVMHKCWHLKIITCVRLQEESRVWK